MMFDFFDKILIGLLVICFVILFACCGVIIYKAAIGDKDFFVRKVYIVNQDFCKEVKK